MNLVAHRLEDGDRFGVGVDGFVDAAQSVDWTRRTPILTRTRDETRVATLFIDGCRHVRRHYQGCMGRKNKAERGHS